MAALLLPNTIDNLTPADGAEVQQNFAGVQAHINTNLIARDGTVAMAAPLLLVGDPTLPNHAANKEYVDTVFPVGIMFPYGGATAPAGRWVLANGAALNTVTYPRLFAVLGYRYGGSGASFNVPNMAARVPVGLDSTQVRFDATGKTGGSTTLPVPQHQHGMAHTHGVNITSGTVSADHTHSFTTGTESADHAHGFATSTDGSHQHGAYASGVVAGGSFTGMLTDAGGPWADVTMVAGAHSHSGTTVGRNAAHTHSGSTGGISANHTHAVNGTSDGSSIAQTNLAGTASAEHLAPYVVVNYIMRVD